MTTTTLALPAKPSADSKAGAIAWAIKLRGVTDRAAVKRGDAENLKMGLLIRTSSSLDRVSRAIQRRFDRSRDDHDLKIAYARLFLDIQHAQIDIAHKLPNSDEMLSTSSPSTAPQDGRIQVLPLGVQVTNNFSHGHGNTTTVTPITSEPANAEVLPETR